MGILLGWCRSALRLCLTLACLVQGAMAQTTLAPAEGAGAVSLLRAAAILEDPTGRMTLSQVVQADARGAFAPVLVEEQALSLGFTRSAWWLRLPVRHAGSDAAAFLLEVANPRIASVGLFTPDGQGGWHGVSTGADQPFASRPYANRHFVFPVTLAPGADRVLYLRVQSDIGLIAPVWLWPADDFRRHERADYQVNAWYFGIASAMLLFNLALYLGLRDAVYLRYVVYVLSAVLLLAIKGGQAAEFLSPGGLHWSNGSYYAATSLSVAALVWFSRGMLDTAVAAPRADLFLRALMATHLLVVPAYLWALPVVAPWAMALFLASLAGMLGVVAWCALRRMRSAYYYLAAFAMLFLGALVTLLRTLGVLPTNAFTADGLQLGSALEMLLLAFALADRYHRMRAEKLQAQRELLAAQQTLVDTLQASEQTLVRRVDERTQELEVLNRRLQALVKVDGLTGIANRRHFDGDLQSEWDRARRLGQSLAVLMVDIDWFKAYNDRYGHPAGDEALRAVARTLVATAHRSGDLVARYGGEEFAIVAPATDAASALVLAQKACDAVQALQLPHDASPLGVLTLSCGAAAAVPGPHAQAHELLAAADAALYQAKQQGRNRALLADA